MIGRIFFLSCLNLAKEIIYIYAPLCPKCIRIKKWLKDLPQSDPEIKITKYNMATQFREVKKYNIKTIPTLIIGEQRLDGWIKEEEFKDAIEKL
ncbi:MAG: thioredoxin family protein [Asgard group archaeon]|nr:thioredoxin family protein [Asgard group archaeon]